MLFQTRKEKGIIYTQCSESEWYPYTVWSITLAL